MIGAFIGFGVLTLLGGPSRPGGSGDAARPLYVSRGDARLRLPRSGHRALRYRPLRDAPRIAPLISALGVAFFLENSALLLFGSQFRSYDGFDLISYNGFHFGGRHGVFIQYLGLFVVVVALLLMVALIGLVRWTQARQGDARGLVRPRGRCDDGHRRRPRHLRQSSSAPPWRAPRA